MLQVIEEISTTKGKPVILGPLLILIMVSAIKDLFEDLKRRKQDEKENFQPVLLSQNGEFRPIPSSFLHVGNVVKIRKNEYFPCDVVLLHSSSGKNVAYVETK